MSGEGADRARASTAGVETLRAEVLIIGGGATGTGLARDLALRGVPCLLVERRDLGAGASGGNHGLLHSGARYVSSDPEAAAECLHEGDILRRIAPQCIEDTGGLFVAVAGDDERYAADFPGLCVAAGIPCRTVSPAEARDMESALSEGVIAAFAVRDASIDPFMLCLDNMAHALDLGAKVRRNARVEAFDLAQGRIAATRLTDKTTGRPLRVEARVVVNASGAWSGLVAALAGIRVGVLYSQGTLVVTQDRLARRVINRLRPPADSDIIVPGGTVSIVGTTSVRIDHPDHCRATVAEVDAIIDAARAMVPRLETARFIRAYAGVRPLFAGAGTGSDGHDRAVSRGYSILDHARDGVDNLVTITGGKLTTYRLMAEKTADLVCAKLGHGAPCRTAETPVPASDSARWKEPGRGPRAWIENQDGREAIICECEMVSQAVITDIALGLGAMRGRSVLKAIGLRTRLGMGPCQGGFCSLRAASHLYDIGVLEGPGGLDELRAFIQRRWRGKAPVLWGLQMEQADVQEAVHCGVMDLELSPGRDEG